MQRVFFPGFPQLCLLSPPQARSSLRGLESRRGFELKILKALGTELTVQTQNIIYHLGEEWQKLIVWKLPPSKGAHRGFFHSFCPTEVPVFPCRVGHAVKLLG